MAHVDEYRFPPFRLALADMRLFRGDTPIELRPKTFAVLACLAAHAGQLVTKQGLLDAVWPDVVVGDDVLKGCIRELRDALGDDSTAPRYIQTAHRRGYRFIAELARAGEDQPLAPRDAESCVGREAELARLRAALTLARSGARRCVFVVGEAGSGKTTLSSRFVGQLDARVLRGQCIDQFGAGEPLLPVLDALSQLARLDPDAGELLDRVAPRWRPGRAGAAGSMSTASSMLRELADAIDALTPARGLVLVIEDLHWSDPTTLALLSLLVTRTSASPLLVVASFRPAEPGAPPPLVGVTLELEQRGRAERLMLAGLDTAAVERLVCERFAARRAMPELAAVLQRRTGGSPMFVAAIADELHRRADLRVEAGELVATIGLDAVAHALPAGLRSMIGYTLARLGATQREVLEVLALAGVPLPAAVLAAIVRRDVVEVELDCERLCEPPRALAREATRDAPGYAPVHALFRDIVAEAVPLERAAQLHRELAHALTERPQLAGLDPSHVLALHHERARQPDAAARWLAVAAEHAAARHAAREALALADRGLALLGGARLDLPDVELRLLLVRGRALIELHGFGAEALAPTFERAMPLAEAIADDRRRAAVLFGLRAYHAMRNLDVAFRLCREVEQLAHRLEDAGLLLQAHSALGDNTFCRGELGAAEQHYTHAERLTTQLLAHGIPAEQLGVGINAARKSLARHIAGHFDQALASLTIALADAGARADPFQRALVLVYAGFLHLMRREPERARAYAREALQVAERDGFRYWTAAALVILGSSNAELGQLELGIADMRRGIALWQAIGALVLYPSFVAELGLALARQGALDEALAQLQEARRVVADSGEAVLLPELLRLEGEWVMGRDPSRSAELLDEALALARSQGARAFELRIMTTRLAYERRAGTPERRAALRVALAELCAGFDEGAELADLREARAALVERA